MSSVADKHAHILAMYLELILFEYSGTHYNEALDKLGHYRLDMEKIHQQLSPTFMGEPLMTHLVKDAQSNQDLKISSDGSTLIDPNIHWIPVSAETPRNVKMLLINEKHGVTVLGNYTPDCQFTHYAGLPKFRK